MSTHKENKTLPDFEQLVSTYYKPLYRFAYSLSKNENDACDLTQETFLIWANKGSSLRDVSKVKSWLFTTLYREFLGNRRHALREPPQEEWEGIEEPTSLSSQTHLVNSIDGAEAVVLLAEIEPIYREPLTLFYLKQFSYKEIAKILGLPIGTIMSRLSRGKSILKKKFSKGSPKSLIKMDQWDKEHPINTTTKQ